MKILDTEIMPIGMGCWPIGGPFYNGDTPLGFANVSDAESLRTIHAAIDAGIRLFDTAAVYGAGHAERLLGQALRKHPEALIVSKIGMGFNEKTKQIASDETSPKDVMPAIDRCLKRLQRDRIDVLLLHLNALPPAQANMVFDAMEKARQRGKIRSFGWSTDFPDSINATCGREGFIAVEHAMNVFFDAAEMQTAVENNALIALQRSPLAMGLLSGKYTTQSNMQPNDIRAGNEKWRDYFRDGKPNADYLSRLNAIRELLQSDGRSLPQGALCWLLTKSDRNIPIPGARTVEQVVDNAGAVAKGKLAPSIMDAIEALLDRGPQEPVRPR